MKPEYLDITSRIAEPPRWYDRHGVPRYDAFHPDALDVYAVDAVLMEIACQACSRRFLVADVGLRRHADAVSLVDAARRGWLAYGDPPRGCCSMGATMTSLSLRAVEVWTRANDQHQWTRVPDAEVPQEDADG